MPAFVADSFWSKALPEFKCISEVYNESLEEVLKDKGALDEMYYAALAAYYKRGDAEHSTEEIRKSLKNVSKEMHDVNFFVDALGRMEKTYPRTTLYMQCLRDNPSAMGLVKEKFYYTSDKFHTDIIVREKK